jgi:hypothetical protein
MSLRLNNLAVLGTLATVLTGALLLGKNTGTKEGVAEKSTRAIAQSLWQAPTDISSRNLFYGPGGARKQPGRVFKFIKEDLGGSNPKFIVEDENRVKWKVKLGDEAQPETAASRIVWAAGYHADVEYLVRVLHVSGLPGRLSRGANLIQPDGTVRNARLKREGDKRKVGTWRWRKAPFEGTREFNGLRVLMALIDNWDLKDENNGIYEQHGLRIYEVSDLGASFGTTGVLLAKDKAKGNLRSFKTSKFVTKVTNEDVKFGTPSLPSLPYVFSFWDYARRARLRWIGRQIKRADAKWIGGILAQLSTKQIEDAFRAAGYSPSEIEGFSTVLEQRIKELNAL